MKLSTLRQRLGWRLFFSYLVIIVVGAGVLMGTAALQLPTSVARHLSQMEAALGHHIVLAADLNADFQAAVNEVLTIATLVAFLGALSVSIFSARRIIGPIRDMMKASLRIASGDYHERVQVTSEDELGTLARAFNRMAETLEQT